jgi:hypothetical protein
MQLGKPLDAAALAAQVIRANLLAFSAGSIFLYIFYRKYGTSSRHIPGPFLASITDFWRVWAVADGTFHTRNLKLHEKYGPLVRIAPNVVSVSDPDAMRVIYGLNSGFIKVK